MTRAEILAGFVILEDAIGKQFSPHAADTWAKLLGDITLDAYIHACNRAACEQTFPVLPTMAQIRSLAIEHVHGVAETPESAYARALQARSRHGLTESHEARRLVGEDVWDVITGIGGWSRFCELLVSERGTFFAQFRDAWLRLMERQTQQRRLPVELRPRLAVSHLRIGQMPEGVAG